MNNKERTKKMKNEIQKTESKLLTVSNLKSLTDEINKEHQEILTAKLYIFEKAISLGHKIIQLKEGLPYGKFMSYVKENLPLISRATSNRYMALAENELELREKLGNDLELKKAYKYLADKNKPTQTEKNLVKAIEKNQDRKAELKERNNMLKRVERKLLKGEFVDEPEKTITKETYEERLKKAEKQAEKYRKLLEQITHSE